MEDLGEMLATSWACNILVKPGSSIVHVKRARGPLSLTVCVPGTFQLSHWSPSWHLLCLAAPQTRCLVTNGIANMRWRGSTLVLETSISRQTQTARVHRVTPWRTIECKISWQLLNANDAHWPDSAIHWEALGDCDWTELLKCVKNWLYCIRPGPCASGQAC